MNWATGALFASVGLLLGCAFHAWVVYVGAVALGHRSYLHVVLATAFLIAVELIAISAIRSDSIQAKLLLVANVLGIGAMLSLARRFR